MCLYTLRVVSYSCGMKFEAPNLVTLAERLIWARKAAGLSQYEVADAAGVSRAVYNRLEKGKNATTGYAVQIAQKLGVNPHWLVTGDGTPFGVSLLHIANDSHLIENQPHIRTWPEIVSGSGGVVFRYVFEGDAMIGGKPNDIPHGATLLVDREKAGRVGSVHLVNYKGYPIVGILQAHGPELIIKPNNPAYPPTPIDKADLVGAVTSYTVVL